MSDNTAVENLFREKISLEFSLFYFKQKDNLREGIEEEAEKEERMQKKRIIKKALKTAKRELRKTGGLSNAEIAELYIQYTQKQEYDAYEGFFKERKKCSYCLRFIDENYAKGTSRFEPCDRIAAQRKLKEDLKLSDEEKIALGCGYLDCGDKFAPMLDKEDADAELALQEKEQISILAEWKKNLQERIASNNF